MNIVPIILAAALLLGGCAHQVTFQDATYAVGSARNDASVVAVIDPETLSRKVAIRSFMTGIAHSWEAEPGDMLRQVAAIELPQVFAHYEHATRYQEPSRAGRAIVLELAVPEYQFDEFRAKVGVTATLYGRGRKRLLHKTYRAEGATQGNKMFWGGAFGMKSAIRQSSLDAYRKVFVDLRADIAAELARP